MGTFATPQPATTTNIGGIDFPERCFREQRGFLAFNCCLSPALASRLYDPSYSGESVTVGRSSKSALQITSNQAVSSKHFSISRTGNDFIIEDSGSTNGTFVLVPGGSEWTRIPVNAPTSLPIGSIVRITKLDDKSAIWFQLGDYRHKKD